MKKVLIFSLAYYPRFVGGAEVAIREITDRISPGAIAFHLITLRFDAADPAEEQIGNVIVHRIGRGARGMTYAILFSWGSYLAKILFIPRAAFAARALHRRERFDALWAMMSYMLLPIVLLRFLGVRLPYLLTLQEGDPFEHVFNRPQALLARPFLRAGFRGASAVQAISHFLAGWAAQAGFTGTPLIIPNGVAVASFARVPDAEQSADALHALGKRSDDVFLITVSRLVHKNAVDDVIRALAQLPPRVHFAICGTGPDENALHALAEKEGVAARVHFLGHVTHDRLPALLHAADVFVRPSRSEGMGNAFIEAMAAGLPVIATQEGGIGDFLFDEARNPGTEPTGWAVDANAPDQIAGAVEKVLATPEKTARITAAAKKLAAERYDWELVAERMHDEAFTAVLGA